MAQSESASADVIIIGGGLIGLAQGLALAAHGISSHIVDRADPAVMMADGFDGRTSAISSSSMKMFEAIGLGGALSGKGCPIEQIWVSDGLKPGELDFVPGEDDGYLGQMFENKLLRRTLLAAAQDSELIHLHMPAQITEKLRDAGAVRVTLDNGSILTGQLLIVAEGRQSQTREEAGLKIAHWQYDHAAIVGAIFHEKAHENIAYEIFYPTGPFAVLPMLDDADGRHRSAIVWSQTRGDAPAYLKLSPRGFAAELEKAMGHMLGAVELAAPLSSYPLGFHHAGQITEQRLALIGDSAHGIHPIAGQGLNLGLRDVASLTEVLVDGVRLGLDLGDAQLLERYGKWRSVDTMMVAVATDGLNRLFSVPGKTASAVRRLGMAMVQRTKPAKAFFMSEARGESGSLPKLLKGSAI
ncbi:FAD-dependent monooxygenase [Sphingorhabdus arenilitoris]|uniref:FAD-dependent monooxygenase n=1 Tax=Sphingorhabdus arenilitoris TaxID=1490041 RepID=A0ABV8RJF7_9SPHN